MEMEKTKDGMGPGQTWGSCFQMWRFRSTGLELGGGRSEDGILGISRAQLMLRASRLRPP